MIERNNLEEKLTRLTANLRQKEEENYSIPDILSERD